MGRGLPLGDSKAEISDKYVICPKWVDGCQVTRVTGMVRQAHTTSPNTHTRPSSWPGIPTMLYIIGRRTILYPAQRATAAPSSLLNVAPFIVIPRDAPR